MRWLLGCLFLLAAINLFAQAPAPAHDAPREPQVVRVQIGHICGWCGGAGYRTDLTTVERLFIMREMADAGNPKAFPKRKERRTISKREWETLVRSLDAEALKALPQDGTCRPCVDQPDAWVEIDYSDGSKLSVHYDWYSGKEPAPVKALKFPNLPIVFHQF